MTPGPGLRTDLAREMEKDALERGCLARMGHSARSTVAGRASSPKVASMLRRAADRLDPPCTVEDGVYT